MTEIILQVTSTYKQQQINYAQQIEENFLLFRTRINQTILKGS